ncbi:MAG: histidine kinase response regulator hybrid protein [Bacteroidota bacterium]|jgi:signal transduction histidine kinase|nr:histidine kinase response regulator hybrid protein [Bacteroidota bacterium]
MVVPDKHEREKERLKSLESYSILDSLPEKDYDDLTTIAAEICGTPISLVTLVDENRQWFKSHHGVNITETPIEYAFCSHTISSSEKIFIVNDSREDERFHDNPLVTHSPHVIFYAGVPLINHEGLPLGTLCVIDHKPRNLNERQITSLKALASQVMNLLELRKNKNDLEKALKIVQENNFELERFAYIAAHDLKSPLNNISALTGILRDSMGSEISDETQQIISHIESSSDKLKTLIDALLNYSKATQVVKHTKTDVDLTNLRNELSGLFKFKDNFNFRVLSSLSTITVNKIAIDQILLNLIANAIKYSDKDIVKIDLHITDQGDRYEFHFIDNGPGFTNEKLDKAFDIFETFNTVDKYGRSGNGIGLAIVKKTIESLGGTIYIDSEHKGGAKFVFTLEK